MSTRHASRAVQREPPSTVVWPESDQMKRVGQIYDRLLEAYGKQGWWPADSSLEMIIGAILTQACAWENVTKAIRNLKRRGVLSLGALDRIAQLRLAALIRPAGYYNAKAAKIKAFVKHVKENHGLKLSRMLTMQLPVLREELLSIYGIGPETADSIILYAASKPVFVVDAYTRRLLLRLGLIIGRENYQTIQDLFARSLAPDAGTFKEYHALIVEHAKQRCRAKPLCDSCPLLSMCSYGKRIAGTMS